MRGRTRHLVRAFDGFAYVTTGALSMLKGSPFPAGDAPRSVTVDPSGRFSTSQTSFGTTWLHAPSMRRAAASSG